MLTVGNAISLCIQNGVMIPLSACALVQMPAVVRRVAKPLAYAAVLMAVWASHAATLPIQIGAALMTVAAIGLQGVRRGSLNLSGASDRI